MDAEQRAKERRGAAVVRALGRRPRAEYRVGQLTVDDQPVALAAPYLLAANWVPGAERERGIYDSVAVRLRYSDDELFAATEPESVVARIVFDMCEQLRCESLVPDELAGTRQNVEAAFRMWCRGEQITGTAVGLLIFTVLHMVRSRLISPIHDELIEDQIEATRAGISPIIGPALKGMREHRTDQQEFAIAARSLADAVDAMVDDPGSDKSPDELDDDGRGALLVPPEWADELPEIAVSNDDAVPLPTSGDSQLESLGGYRIFTTEHDVVQHADDLYPEDRRRKLRYALNEQIAAQSVSAFTLARRLRRVFRGVERDGWLTGEEEGQLDSARLGQLVANPTNTALFRQPRYRPTAPAVVSILIDNSGSMKSQRHETVAVLVDTLARALDLAGATSEILGFTTNSWNGGEARLDWRRAGEPESPGRVAELSHIIYKDADTSWKRSRLSIAALLRTHHFRESVDGEAIVWAYRRLVSRPEQRKFLVVVTDGAPLEAVTRRTNGPMYLEAHQRHVVEAIEREGHVSIGAITIDESIESLFTRSVDMDVSGTLTLADYRLLERLFSTHR